MTLIIALYVVFSIATIIAWISYTNHEIHDPENYRGCNNFSLGLAILFTLVTYGLFVATIHKAKREVKTSVPEKVELVVTEEQENGVANQTNTSYVCKFQ